MKKKALVVLLAIAMVFCFASAAMAAEYSDMGNTTKATQDAVNRLSGLGVIDGYTDGTFGPNNNIRRDEMAKIATIAAGFASSADSMKNQSTGYTDARSGIWSTGYINIASAQGYMKGVGNNKFNPAANITNAEVLTTVLRMYGYNDNLTGPWPINYVNQAVKDGITDDVANFASGSTATRGDVAIMVSAALDQWMVEYSKDTESFQEKQYPVNDGQTATNAEKRTLFQVAFAGETREKLLVTELTVDQYDAEEGATYNFTAGGEDYTADEDTVINGADFWGLNNKYVTVTYDDKNDNYAKVITVTSSTVDFTELELTGDNKVKANGTTYYFRNVSDADKFEISDFSGVADTLLKDTGDKIKAADMNDKGTINLDYEGKVYGISVDRDNDDANLGTIALVTKVEADKEKLAINDGASNATNWDNLEKVVIVKDGEIVTPADLAAGDILKYKAAGRVAVVSDADVTGTVGKNKGDAKNDKVAIGDVEVAQGATMDFVEVDGDKYDFDDRTNLLVAATDGLYGKEVSIVKNNANQIAMVIYNAAETSTYYGVVTNRTTSGDGDWTTAAGNVNTLTIFGEEGKAVEYTVNADERDDAAITGLNLGDVVKYTLNKDGEITAVAVVDAATAPTNGFEISNNKYLTIGNDAGSRYAFADDAVVYNLTEDDGKLVVEKVDLATVLAKDELTYNSITVGSVPQQTINNVFVQLDSNGRLIECLAVTDMQGSAAEKYAIVDSKFAYEGNSYITFVGDSNEYKVDMDTISAKYNGVKSGDIVEYAVTGGKVSTLEKQVADETGFKLIDEVSGSLVYYTETEETKSYELASDVNVYVWDIDAEKFVIGALEDVDSDAYILTLGEAEDDDTYKNVVIIDADKYAELAE